MKTTLITTSLAVALLTLAAAAWANVQWGSNPYESQVNRSYVTMPSNEELAMLNLAGNQARPRIGETNGDCLRNGRNEWTVLKAKDNSAYRVLPADGNHQSN